MYFKEVLILSTLIAVLVCSPLIEDEQVVPQISHYQQVTVCSHIFISYRLYSAIYFFCLRFPQFAWNKVKVLFLFFKSAWEDDTAAVVKFHDRIVEPKDALGYSQQFHVLIRKIGEKHTKIILNIPGARVECKPHIFLDLQIIYSFVCNL